MNKNTKVLISIILLVWIFLFGLNVGKIMAPKQGTAPSNGGATINVVTQAPPVTQAPVTQAPVTQAPQQGGETTAPAATPGEETTAPNGEAGSTGVPQTNAEIAEAFNKAMNATKHSTRNCHAVKNSAVQLQVTDCSVSSLTSMVNSIAQRFTTPESAEYNFVNGRDESAGISIGDDLPPSGRDVALDEGGIAQAAAEPYGDGGYKMTITLIPEQSSLGQEPRYHANSVGFLDLESLGIDSVEFTKADFSYSGATVTIAVNGDGLIDTYDCVLPMAGTGEGKLKIVSASATLEGSSTENWVFTWQ